MARCAVCNSIMFGGYSHGEERFCSLVCYTYSPIRDFCLKCVEETTDESPGNTTNPGMRLVDAKDRCPDCHAIVQRKLLFGLVFWWTPTRYRVLYVGHKTYVGRRIKDRYLKSKPLMTSILDIFP